MRVRYHPEAAAEVREHRNWYAARSPLSALKFAQAIDDAVARIREAPERYPEREFGNREYVVPRTFPFRVVYRIHSGEIVIVAVAHQSREPGYWRFR